MVLSLGTYSLKMALLCRNMPKWSDCNVLYTVSAVSWHIKCKYYTVMNPSVLYQLKAHTICSIHIFITNYPLHVFVFVTPSSERPSRCLLKKNCTFFCNAVVACSKTVWFLQCCNFLKNHIFCNVVVTCSKAVCLLQWCCNFLKNYTIFAMLL